MQRYINIHLHRYTLFSKWLPNDYVLDLKLLTCGNPIHSNEQKEIILKYVFEYVIKRSEMFLVVYVVHQENKQTQTHTHNQSLYSPLSSLFFFNLHILR